MQMRYCKTKCWAYLIFRKVFGTPGNGFRSPPLISFASRSLLSKVEKGERCLRLMVTFGKLLYWVGRVCFIQPQVYERRKDYLKERKKRIMRINRMITWKRVKFSFYRCWSFFSSFSIMYYTLPIAYSSMRKKSLSLRSNVFYFVLCFLSSSLWFYTII